MGAETTEIIARGVVRRDSDLLVVRLRNESWWFLPGGHVEPGEPVEAALVRELAEELGVKATVDRFLGAVEYGYVDDGIDHHEVNLVFQVVIDDPDPVAREEHLELHWLPLDHLADADVRPSTLRDALVPDQQEGPPFWRGWCG
jgi:8-oxo-dGTP diphosphatase